MSYSMDAHSRNQKIFSRETMEAMTPQQRQFAQNQFRRIYAEQMSKLMYEMSLKKRVKDNLETLDQQEKQTIAQIDSKLKLKMMESDRKRHENMENKLKLYKLNEEKWKTKMNDITRKFKSRNRQAYQKAEQIRLQAEKYWEDKKINRHLSSDRSKVSIANHDQSRLQNKTAQIRKNTLPSIAVRQNISEYRSLRRQVSNQNTIMSPQKSKADLNNQIKKHKQKAVYLQREKQQMILKKALEKMDIIESKRMSHKHDTKVSEPTIPRKPKSKKLIDTSYGKNERHNYTIDVKHRNQHHLSRSKESLDNLIAIHKEAKSKKEQEQFIHRGEVFDKEQKKSKKTKILRMIREKVHTLKMQTIKNTQNI